MVCKSPELYKIVSLLKWVASLPKIASYLSLGSLESRALVRIKMVIQWIYAERPRQRVRENGTEARKDVM